LSLPTFIPEPTNLLVVDLESFVYLQFLCEYIWYVLSHFLQNLGEIQQLLIFLLKVPAQFNAVVGGICVNAVIVVDHDCSVLWSAESEYILFVDLLVVEAVVFVQPSRYVFVWVYLVQPRVNICRHHPRPKNNFEIATQIFQELSSKWSKESSGVSEKKQNTVRFEHYSISFGGWWVEVRTGSHIEKRHPSIHLIFAQMVREILKEVVTALGSRILLPIDTF